MARRPARTAARRAGCAAANRAELCSEGCYCWDWLGCELTGVAEEVDHLDSASGGAAHAAAARAALQRRVQHQRAREHRDKTEDHIVGRREISVTPVWEGLFVSQVHQSLTSS